MLKDLGDGLAFVLAEGQRRIVGVGHYYLHRVGWRIFRGGVNAGYRRGLASRGLFRPCCGAGLDAAAKGMGLAGKTQGVSGDLAPVLWAQGRREEVLAYVGQDVRIASGLATACEALGELRWVTRSGKVRSLMLSEGWLTVSEALGLPLPDTSWMDEPWRRERFTGWTG